MSKLRRLNRFALLSGLCLCLCGMGFAQNIEINATNFPDAAFRTHVKSYDVNGDNVLSLAEREAVTGMWPRAGITDLTGIKHFTKLEILNVALTDLTSLDVSQLLYLTTLVATNSSMRSIDAHACVKLTTFEFGSSVETLDARWCEQLADCYWPDKGLKYLDISGCINLWQLNCTNNHITTLRTQGCLRLKKLHLNGNQLSSLNLSGFTQLSEVNVVGNILQKLDVSNCEQLSILRFNQVDTLNVSNTGLTGVWWNDGYHTIKVLNAQNCANLETLNCDNIGLVSADVSGCAKLSTWNFVYSNNSLKRLDISNCPLIDYVLLETNKCDFELVRARNCGLANGIAWGGLRCDTVDISGSNFTGGLWWAGLKAKHLDFSHCTKLTIISIADAGTLQSIYVNECSALTELHCQGNQLTALDAHTCPALKTLNCDNNTIASLSVRGCPELTLLSCYNNPIKRLDISGCTSMTTLTEVFPNLEVLRARGCINMSSFWVNAPLDTIDVSGSGLTGDFGRDNNPHIRYLDLSDCKNLKNLSCQNSPKLSFVNISGCTALEQFFCKHNPLLESLDASSCPELKVLNVSFNDLLKTLNVAGNTKLSQFECIYNPLLSNLNVSSCPELREMNVSRNGLKTLNVAGATKLYNLVCEYNQLTDIDLSGCESLLWLTCWHNQLSSLDVSMCPLLESLAVSDNPISALDITQNPKMFELWCAQNQLSALDLSNAPLLKMLECQDNQISALNLGNCPKLQKVWCYNNQLSTLTFNNTTFDPGMPLEVLCQRNQLTELNLNNRTNLVTLNCDTNRLSYLGIENTTNLKNLDAGHNELADLSPVDVPTTLEGVGFGHNHLPLSILNRFTGPSRRALSEQQITLSDVTPDEEIDLHSEMSFGGKTTHVLFLSADNLPLAAEYYTMGTGSQAGMITFRKPGVYHLQFTNAHITSTTPAEEAAVHYTVTVIDTTVDIPVFSIDSGAEVKRNRPLSISCSTPQAQIYYTTDTTLTPSTSTWTLYTDALNITASTTYKAFAVREGWQPSAVTTASYTMLPDTVETPIFTPSASMIVRGSLVSITTSTPNAVIYYTTNGSLPDTVNNKLNTKTYTTPLSIDHAMTIKAIAYRYDEPYWVPSILATATYTMVPDTVVNPFFTPSPKAVACGTEVEILCGTPSAKIYYTLDGSSPDTVNNKANTYAYKAGEKIVINQPTIIKAIAYPTKIEWWHSDTVTGRFTIAPNKTPAPTFSIPTGKKVAKGETVAISAVEGASIFYSVDRKNATPFAAYSSPLTINDTLVLRAYALKSGICYTSSDTITALYILAPDTVAPIVFTPPAGNVKRGTLVSLSTATEGARIYYTIDGSLPDTVNNKSRTKLFDPLLPIPITEDMVIRAWAVKNGYWIGVRGEAEYKRLPDTVDTPVFSPNGGEVKCGDVVEITVKVAGTDIYYTLDGSNPNPYKNRNAILYNEENPIIVTEGISVIKAIGIYEMDGWVPSLVGEASFTIMPQKVAAPTFSIPVGTHVKNTTLRILAPGATIHYTTDGSTPTTESATFGENTNDFVLDRALYPNDTLHLKALAVKGGACWIESDVADGIFVIAPDTVETPVFSLSDNAEVRRGTVVRISVPKPSDAHIFYTTDLNVKPDTSNNQWIRYNDIEGIVIGRDITLRAFATYPKWINSKVAIVSYSITPDTVATPLFTPEDGAVRCGTEVSLSCANPSAKIYYTLNGSTPDTVNNKANTLPYTEGQIFTINAAMTIKARAYLPGGIKWEPSLVATAVYTIDPWKVEAPAFSVPSGKMVAKNSTVALSTTTPDAKIYYTTDGTKPLIGQSNTSLYSTPVVISQAVTIKAFAHRADLCWTASDTITAFYALIPDTVAVPKFSPVSGSEVARGSKVTLSVDKPSSGATIYYTTDQTLAATPNPATWSLYTADGVTINRDNMSVWAFATYPNWINSKVGRATYTLHPDTVDAPKFTPDNDVELTCHDVIVLTTVTSTTKIYYTLDGSDPDINNHATTFLYTAPIAIHDGMSESLTVKAFATKEGKYVESDTVTKVYTIKSLPSDKPYFPRPTEVKVAKGETVEIKHKAGTSAEEAAKTKLYYTTETDLAPSTETWTLYTTPIAINRDVTLKAFAIRDGVCYGISEVATATYIVAEDTVSPIVFTPAEGKVKRNTKVYISINPEIEDVTIYYTLNGSAPVKGQTGTFVFDPASPINIDRDMTITAEAVKDGYWISSKGSASYTMLPDTVDTPKFSVTGDVKCDDVVKITVGTPNAVIYYTTDGGNPHPDQNAAAKRYTGPIAITGAMTIKAIGIRNEYRWDPSLVATAEYTIIKKKLPLPTADIAGGEMVDKNRRLTLSEAVSEASIYYTTNGNKPVIGQSGTTRYNTPIVIGKAMTIKAFAYLDAECWAPSDTLTLSYTVKPDTVATPEFDPVSGSHVARGSKVLIKVDTPAVGAKIYYTTNPSVDMVNLNPDEWTLYTTAGVTINRDYMDVWAFATYPNWITSKVTKATYILHPDTVKAPTFNPVSAELTCNNTIVLTTEPADSKIYYTLDGSDPDINNSATTFLYTEPIAIHDGMSENLTVKAFATKEGKYVESDTVTKVYTIRSLPSNKPYFTRSTDRKVAKGEKVEIKHALGTSDEEAAITHIYYTRSSSLAPSVDTWIPYTSAITIDKDVTLRAFAIRDGICYGISEVAVVAYVLAEDTVAPIVFTPAPGKVKRNTKVSLSTTTAGAVIYYTTDGSAPVVGQSNTFIFNPTNPINIDDDKTITAEAIKSGYWISSKGRGVYTMLPDTVATPTFSVTGDVRCDDLVEIKTATPLAVIYYTTDGSNPDPKKNEAAKRYTGPIAITGAMTIKAIGIRDEYRWDTSLVATATYTIIKKKLPLPTADIAGGEMVDKNRALSLSATHSADIYYTTNGTRPIIGQSGTTKYSTPVAIGRAMTIKAFAYLDAECWAPSDTLTLSYTVKPDTVASPEFDPVDGSHVARGSKVLIKVDTPVAGAKIYYTTNPALGNASTPNPDAWTLYNEGGVTINQDITIWAFGTYTNWINSKVAKATYILHPDTVDAPKFSPATGEEITCDDKIYLSCDTTNVRIYYSTDGNKPAVGRANTYLYTDGITLNGSMNNPLTVWAFAIKDGRYVSSDTVKAVYTIKPHTVSTPAFSIESGTAVRKGLRSVEITTTTPGGAIYYTTDGSTPTTASSLYTTPIVINEAVTIKAIAYIAGNCWETSAVATTSYVIKPETPTFEPQTGGITCGETVVLSTKTENATIYYTTNGSTPDPVGNADNTKTYSAPIVIKENVTLKAVAVKDEVHSDVVAQTYTAQYFTTLGPTFTPPSGTKVKRNAKITLSGGTPGADFHYTTSTATPNLSSPVYSTPLVAVGEDNATFTVKVLANLAGDDCWKPSDVITATYTILPDTITDAPYFVPAPGAVKRNTTVEIRSDVAGAKIYYTTDGSEPTTASPLFKAGDLITINVATTIKAFAAKTGWLNSAVVTGEYTIALDTVKTPVISPKGELDCGTLITLSTATDGATIYYTTDGSTPDTTKGAANTKVYTAPFALTHNIATVKAVAVKDDMIISKAATASYTVNRFITALPTFEPADKNLVERNSIVTLSATGATVYFTLDKSEPITSSPTFVNSRTFTVNDTITIKAFALKTGDACYLPSATVTKTYYPIPDTVAPVAFSPKPGIVPKNTEVILTTQTSGAKIYYTTDGTTPLEKPEYLYLGGKPIIIASGYVTIKAFAAKAGLIRSKDSTVVYNAPDTVATPIFTPDLSAIECGSSITLTSTPGANIYYTTDGSKPDTANNKTKTYLYTAPIPFDGSKVPFTVRAFALKDGNYIASVESNKTYTIKPIQLSTPTFSHKADMYAKGTKVSIIAPHNEPTATIYYTKDRSKPTALSAIYTSALTLTDSVMIKAFAVSSHACYSPSDTAIITYYVIPDTAKAPYFDPLAGVVARGTEVVIRNNTDGATIRYALNEKATKASPIFKAGDVITITEDVTVWAFAFKDGLVRSKDTFATYIIAPDTVKKPTFEPGTGGIVCGSQIKIKTSTTSAKIYYTLDGTKPIIGNDNTYEYNDNAPIVFDGSISPLTIKAFAFREGRWVSFDTATAIYTIQQVKASQPTFSPAPGMYTKGTSVTMTPPSEDPNAAIYYTSGKTIPADPTTSSTQFTNDNPILLKDSVVIRAYAVPTHVCYSASNVAMVKYYVVPDTVDMPHFTPAADPETGKALVARKVSSVIATDTTNTTIYYTLNGTEPTLSSARYTGPILIEDKVDNNHQVTIKAFAVKNGLVRSKVATITYILAPDTVPAPKFTPAGGNAIVCGSTITLSSPVADKIYYTTDGSTPTDASLLYTAPIPFEGSTVPFVIKAFAYKDGYYVSSAVVSASYTIQPVKISQPTFAPEAGMYQKGTSVVIHTPAEDPNAALYYTTDDTKPSTASLRFPDSPITLSDSVRIKAFAVPVSACYLPSDTAEVRYTVIPDTTKTPYFLPKGGIVARGTKVVIKNNTDGATIRYTTDGTTPGESSPIFAQGDTIRITQDMTVRAFAFKEGLVRSKDTFAVYILAPDTVLKPTIEPTSGAITCGTSIVIKNNTPGAKIYYTTDGSKPVVGRANTKEYTAPVVFDGSQSPFVIKAFAFMEGRWVSFDTTEATYAIKQVELSKPTFTPAPGLYVRGSEVKINAPENAAKIYYTLDGVKPVVGEENTHEYNINLPLTLTTRDSVDIWVYVTPNHVCYKACDVAVRFKVVPDTVDTPHFTPAAKDETNSVIVARKVSALIGTDTTNTTIYYTLDGTEPTLSSTPYTGGILIEDHVDNNHQVTIKAFAVKSGLVRSKVATITYILAPDTVDAPVAAPQTGAMACGNTITLSSAAADRIYYTLDGSTPTEASLLYTDPIPFDGSTSPLTIKAFAVTDRDYYISSSVAVFTYTLDPIQLAEPTFTPEPGKYYEEGTQVRIALPDHASVVYYTTDGTQPGTTSAIFSNNTPVVLTQDSVDIKAFAVSNDVCYKSSSIVTVRYYVIPDTVDAPYFEPQANMVVQGDKISPDTVQYNAPVAIMTKTEGTQIYYTTNGSEPDLIKNPTYTKLYTAPVRITQDLTIKAYAIKQGMARSKVSSFTYYVARSKVQTPGFIVDPEATDEGAIVCGATITITSEPNAKIYYTLDGSEPDTTNQTTTHLYQDPITFGSEMSPLTIKAFAKRDGYEYDPSEVVTKVYTLLPIKLENPTFSHADGLQEKGTEIKIGLPDHATAVHYTTDRSKPTTASPIFSDDAPIVLNDSVVIKAFAVSNTICYLPSDTVTIRYTVVPDTVQPPYFGPRAGVVSQGTEVVIRSLTEGATIYYTTDGTRPSLDNIGTSTFIFSEENSIIEIGNRPITVRAFAVKEGMVNSKFTAAIYELLPDTARKPYFTNETLSLTCSDSIRIKTTTNFANIYYTLDNEQWLLYENPIPFDGSQSPLTIRAFAQHRKMVTSDTSIETFIVEAVPAKKPTFSIESGIKANKTRLRILAPGATTIYYTTDGSIPTESSSRFNSNSADLILDRNLYPNDTLRLIAMAVTNGACYLPSDTAVGLFIIAPDTVATPVFSIATNSEIKRGTKITITTATENARIFYSTGGGDPDTATWTRYTAGGITINREMTIWAFAVKEDMVNSKVAAAVYLMLPDTAEMPIISVTHDSAYVNREANIVKKGTFISMSTATPDAVIYYTDNNTAAEVDFVVYDSEIQIFSTTTFRAFSRREGWAPSLLATETFIIDEPITDTVATPVFSIADSSVVGVGTILTITTTTDSAQIYYTTDGSTPTKISLLYTGPIVLSDTGTITFKAKAMRKGWISSKVARATYFVNLDSVKTDTVATPVFSMADSSEVSVGTTISITTATEGATIYYTTDGSTPTEESQLYTNPIVLEDTGIITFKAFAVKEGWVSSKVATATYFVYDTMAAPDTVEDPVFSIPFGTVEYGTTVTITTATNGATIYYTTDASIPTEDSPVYTQALSLVENITIKAWATKEGWVPSNVVTAVYFILNKEFKVWSRDRVIYLSKSVGEVEVIAMTGQLIYKGTATAIPVSAHGGYFLYIKETKQRIKVLVL